MFEKIKGFKKNLNEKQEAGQETIDNVFREKSTLMGVLLVFALYLLEVCVWLMPAAISITISYYLEYKWIAFIGEVISAIAISRIIVYTVISLYHLLKIIHVGFMKSLHEQRTVKILNKMDEAAKAGNNEEVTRLSRKLREVMSTRIGSEK